MISLAYELRIFWYGLRGPVDKAPQRQNISTLIDFEIIMTVIVLGIEYISFCVCIFSLFRLSIPKYRALH